MMNAQSAEEQLEQASAPKSYHVEIRKRSNEDMVELIMWCKYNSTAFKIKCEEEWDARDEQPVIFSFESEVDAVAFKLTWSEYL